MIPACVRVTERLESRNKPLGLSKIDLDLGLSLDLVSFLYFTVYCFFYKQAEEIRNISLKLPEP